MNKLYNDKTAVGKGGKVAFWTVSSVLVVGILTTITQNPELFSWKSGLLVAAANVGLVFLKNFADSDVKNW